MEEQTELIKMNGNAKDSIFYSIDNNFKDAFVVKIIKENFPPLILVDPTDAEYVNQVLNACDIHHEVILENLIVSFNNVPVIYNHIFVKMTNKDIIRQFKVIINYDFSVDKRI